MSGKSLTRGFRCLNCPFKSLAAISRRTFATSPTHRKHGAVPAFTPTSNPTLHALLTSMRNNIFLPAHLSKSQQDLIYLDKHRRELEIEPVYAYIKGEQFRLKHIDRVKDVPPGLGGVLQAISLMESEKDWDNLPSLLHGLSNANRQINLSTWEKITRKAGQAGRPDIMLECARRMNDTGYEISNSGAIVELMHQIQRKAVKSRWAARDTKQTLAWAEIASELLENQRHARKRDIEQVEDIRVRPEVIGVLLQLSAAWATRYYDGVDRDGKVALYTERLLGSPASLLPESAPQNLFRVSRYIAYMAPVLHGMQLALPILGGEPNALGEKIAELEAAIEAQKEILLNKAPKQFYGQAVYAELLGPDAKRVVSTARRHKAQGQAETETKTETEPESKD